MAFWRRSKKTLPPTRKPAVFTREELPRGHVMFLVKAKDGAELGCILPMEKLTLAETIAFQLVEACRDYDEEPSDPIGEI
jgi:hypothetical protein